MLSGSNLGAVFLDIREAFDNVVPAILLEMLARLGVPAKALRFIYFIVSRRFVDGYWERGLLGTRTATRGVSQGSVLNPLLFNLFLMSFIHRNLPEEIKILAYADDVAFYFADPDLKCVFNQLNDAFIIIADNLKLLDLEISTQKTQFCLFFKKRFSTLMKLARWIWDLGSGAH